MIYEVTTGNIFADLGLDHPEELMARAKLLISVNKRIKQSALMKRIPWRKAFKYEITWLVLKDARLKKGLTQKQLADALGIPENHISEMENGNLPISEAMAHILDLDYQMFV